MYFKGFSDNARLPVVAGRALMLEATRKSNVTTTRAEPGTNFFDIRLLLYATLPHMGLVLFASMPKMIDWGIQCTIPANLQNV